MSTLIIVIIVGLIGGVAVAFQVPLAGIITQKMGMLESAFLVHLGGAITAAVLLVFIAGGKVSEWRELPWWVYLSGSLGIIVISSVTYAIPRIGVASALTLLVVGQVVVGALLDHYGLLVETARPMDPVRMLGVGVLFLGTWLIVRN